MKAIPQILSLIFLLATQTILAQVVTVKQNGTGDYTTIQDALDFVGEGDTIIVYPGIFFENIDFKGKSDIVLASTFIYNQADSSKYHTIVDGNQNGSCILLNDAEHDIEINGLTIQNGNGFIESFPEDSLREGGGLYIFEVEDIKIRNCIIKNNYANTAGGGILVARSTVYFEGNIIKNNNSLSGGGILTYGSYLLSFDTLNRNSIFMNFAGNGNDFKINHSPPFGDTIVIILDTATVINPGKYFFRSNDEFGMPTNMIRCEANYAYTVQYDSDLYVDPVNGNDTNTGLGSTEALKSLKMALVKIVADSVDFNTVHAGVGVYSATTNDEIYPLQLKQYVSLLGHSRETSILDAEQKQSIAKMPDRESDFTMKNFKLINSKSNWGYGAMDLRGGGKIVLDSLSFENNTTEISGTSIFMNDIDTVIISNCVFEDNFGMRDISCSIGARIPVDKHYFINNCYFNNNKPNPEYAENQSRVSISLHGTYYFKNYSTVINTLVSNGLSINFSFTPSFPAVLLAENVEANIINCTFADNTEQGGINGAAMGMTWDCKANVYNTVFWGNSPHQITMADNVEEHKCDLSIYNSCVEDGIAGLNIMNEYHTVYYDYTNIDNDPDFLGMWGHPYQINNGSPCIDAGTLNLPDFIELPEFDLAGNARIVGDSIDMGAYEWNPTVGVSEYQPIEKVAQKLMSAAPNPFSHQTTITAKWDFTGHVQLEVYNNSGLRVKVLKSGRSGRGHLQARWNGKDENGNILPTGIYHVVMFWDGEEVEGIKVVKKQ